MNILAIEPYYGGSHKAFLDGWSAASRHQFTVLKLPAYKWKWRMRHGAITFAEEVAGRVKAGEKWDMIFCSDMLNLAEFLGLTPQLAGSIPAVVYFHENQLTYPVQFENERDYQFAMTNMTSALAADGVWFNSAFHRDSFLEELSVFLKKMPDHQPTEAVKQIRDKSAVYPPGISDISAPKERAAGPVRILWAGRWEHDKNPEEFFAALKIIKERGVKFRVSVIGEQFRQVPKIFKWAKEYFADHIDKWGYQQSRAEYEQALAKADFIVSTAEHEFFGISVAEAIAAGAYPVLPKRLAYPEILQLGQAKGSEEFFYDNGIKNLADKLILLIDRFKNDSLQQNLDQAKNLIERFKWSNLSAVLDKAAERVLAK